ncbi:MAG: competence type IV pilus major pilin ComGC [Bacillus sp. (in: firmicutes)]
MKNEKGFTLIEMLIVLLVISILLVLTVPNVVKHQQSIRNKGCDAYVKVVQSQVQAYEIDTGQLPASLSKLSEEGYITDENCPNNESLQYKDGVVSVMGNGS